MASVSSSSELLNDDIEIQSLQKSFVKSTKKSNYGTLRKEIGQPQPTTPMVNVKHRIKPGETLQGISLRYNIPIENIKRANRLWSNDLALIKDVLIVPIPKEKLDELKIDQSELDEIDNKAKSNEQVVELAEYLNKFDSLISESKLKLKNLETSSKLSQTSNYTSFSSNPVESKRACHQKSVDYGDHWSSPESRNFPRDTSLESKKQYPRLDTSLTSTPDYFIADPVNSSSDTSILSNSSYLTTNGSSSLASHHHHNNGSSSSSSSSSRAKLAHKNLMKLEKEKDELFEL